MMLPIKCDNVHCLYQTDNYCQAFCLEMDERGICRSCELLPDDINVLDKKKMDCGWGSESVYVVEKNKG